MGARRPTGGAEEAWNTVSEIVWMLQAAANLKVPFSRIDVAAANMNFQARYSFDVNSWQSA